MIKVFSNLSGSTKVTVESKFLINKETVNQSSYL